MAPSDLGGGNSADVASEQSIELQITRLLNLELERFKMDFQKVLEDERRAQGEIQFDIHRIPGRGLRAKEAHKPIVTKPNAMMSHLWHCLGKRLYI